MRLRYYVLPVCAILALTGCGRYHGKYGGAYYEKNAGTTALLKVPAGVPAPAEEPLYPIPWKVAHAGKASTGDAALLPPDPALHRVIAASQSKKHAKK